MAAAVLVRLNRGMPTLDWKSLEPKGRKNLTAKIVKLQQEYLSILLFNVVLVGVFICLVVVTPPVVAFWPEKCVASCRAYWPVAWCWPLREWGSWSGGITTSSDYGRS